MWEIFPNKECQLIEMISLNFKTPYDVLCFTFYENSASRKEDVKDYTFDSFCDLFIRTLENFLDKDEIDINKHYHFIKGKGRKNYRDISQVGNNKIIHGGYHDLNHDALVNRMKQLVDS